MKGKFEYLLPLIMVMIMGCGLVVLYSATFGETEAYLFGRQVVWALLSGAVFVFTAFVLKRKFWEELSVTFMIISIIALIAVLFVNPVGGSRRWINLGVASFQPSELAKLSLIIFLAYLYSLESRKYLLFSLGFITTVIVAGLIYLEPDLGTTLIIIIIWYFITLMSRKFDRIMIAMTALILLGGPLLFRFGLEPYQRDRLLSFLEPENYASGAAYNTIQAIRAIGSGGMDGRGFLRGTMNRLGFVPADHTDFIFSVIGEEWGFIGAVIIIGLYGLLIWRMWSITRRTGSYFGRLALSGFFVVFAFHVIENIGMNIGLLPVTGIPLPFISYGGSSSMIFALQLGIVQSYGKREMDSDKKEGQ